MTSLSTLRDAESTPLPRIDAHSVQRVLQHGERKYEDQFGARDVWVFAHDAKLFMHYDAAGDRGWLCALATSEDGISWTKHGPVLDLGASDQMDSASASYGTTYFDGERWHMFYLGTPCVTQDQLKTPSFPYVTMKATADSPTGPWRKQPEAVPPRTVEGTWYSHTASPGQVLRVNDEYVMYFSAATYGEDGAILRTLGVARADDLDGVWTVDADPLLPLTEQIENSSMYFEASSDTWFLFTNRITDNPAVTPVPPQDSTEYTDAVVVYWAKDPFSFSPQHKAVVIDNANCEWSPTVIGLPSVTRIGDRLAVYFDGAESASNGHGARDIGVGWLELPLHTP